MFMYRYDKAYQVHIQIQNERYIVSILLFEIGDFGNSDKAKNAFLKAGDFSHRSLQR